MQYSQRWGSTANPRVYLGQIGGKVYGKEQCMGLASPTNAQKMGSVEETDRDHITRQHPVRAIMPVDYN
jgi:hypothetical protein